MVACEDEDRLEQGRGGLNASAPPTAIVTMGSLEAPVCRGQL